MFSRENDIGKDAISAANVAIISAHLNLAPVINLIETYGGACASIFKVVKPDIAFDIGSQYNAIGFERSVNPFAPNAIPIGDRNGSGCTYF